MNFSDDFEENINKLIKWLTVLSLFAIIVWCLIQFTQMIFPNSQEKAPENIEVLKSQNTKPTPTEEMDELLEMENGISMDDDLEILPEDDGSQYIDGKHSLTVNIESLPPNLYFTTLKRNEIKKEKQKLINKKVGENYMDSVLSYGTLERWNPDSFPLKVYIETPEEVPASHINEIKNAFEKWEEVTNGFVSFRMVNSADSADIVCSYPENFYRTCDTDTSSVTSKQYFTYDNNDHIKKSHIDLTYKDCNNEIYAEDLVYAFALREIGHTLGLRGHSGVFQNKILYYPSANKNESVRPEINTMDINTLKLVYSVLPDKTNSDFSDEQLAKLIRPEEVWGDKIERSAKSEKAILYNISRSPDVPALYVALANSYSSQGKYEEALEEYAKAIVMLNDAEFKARVYVRMGDTFSSQKRYLEAAEAYKMSLKSLNNKQNLFDAYFNLGFIYYQQEKLNESLKAYQTALKYVETKDSFYRLLIDMCEIYIKVGNYIDAQKCAEKAYSLFQTDDSTYLAAYTSYLNEEYSKARSYLDEEEIATSGNKMEIALLAQIYYKTKQYVSLQELNKTTNERFPSNPPFTFK